MGAFQAGFKMGGDLYDEIRRDEIAKEDLRMRQEAAARQQQQFNDQQTDRRRVDEAYADYGRLGLPRTTGGPLRPEEGQDYDYQPVQVTPPAGGPDADLAREQALERIAVATRDPNAIRASAQGQRALRQGAIATQAMRVPLKDIEPMLPQLNTNNSTYPILYTGKSKSGYTFLTTEADGSPGKQFTMNEAQLRRFYLAHTLAEQGFGAEGMNELNAVHKDLGEHVSRWNAALNTMATTGNDATHKGNQDAAELRRARAAETSAGASAALARTHGKLYDEQIKDIQENRTHNGEARKLAEEFDALSPQEQAGAKGQALQRRFNMLNAKPGATLGLGAGAGAGKLAQTLTDAEKIQLTKAMDEIAMIQPDRNTGQVPTNAIAQVYRKYGLDPNKFGVETELDKRLKALQQGGQGGPAVDPTRPFFNEPPEKLRALARKPRGTSTEEANAAREELEMRKTEPRLSAF